MSVHLRPRAGHATELAVHEWFAPATPAEADLLAELDAPVLDLGCGPGRLVVALSEQGRPALGVDASPSAAQRAAEAGATVLCRSLFDRLPGEGRWRSVLLFDGNVGIGGDPVRLLRRAGALLAPGGTVVVEVAPPGGATSVGEARLEAHGVPGPWFPWAWVGADALPGIADAAGLEVDGWLRPDGRWVACLRAPAP